MGEFHYENQGTQTYLVYSLNNQDFIDSMSLGMLTNNKIPGLAAAIFTQMDATKYIKYNVSAKISVRQFFEGQVNKKRLLGVFNGIVDAMLSAEDYMIDTKTILLDLNLIFADVSTCETVLICLPVANQGESVDLSTFFKNIMFSTQFDQTENCDHVARIINYLNSTPVFSLTDFKSLLDSLKGNSADSVQRPVQQRVQPAAVAPRQEQSQPKYQPVAQVQTQTNGQSYVQQQVQQTQVDQPVQQVTPQKKQQPQSFQVPTNTPQSTEVSQVPTKPEKQISMFGLLMHYSKENKELYNAQKAAKKAAKAGTTKQKQQKDKKQSTNASFVVPGAPVNSSFSIPGQQGAVNTPQAQTATSNESKPPVQKVPVQPKPINQTYQPVSVAPSVPQGNPTSFGETTVLGGGGAIGETTVLGASSSQVQVQPHLIRTKNNERINLDKPVFRIGKERSYVDYFVSDNTAVSRSHANIISRDGQYYIVDTNSTNHTYVNGGMIQSNVETPLSDGARIRLANEDFEFRLY